MSWVVDTCVLIDVLEDDPSFGKTSATCLQSMLKDGLVVAIISYIELAPAFNGNLETQDDFLDKVIVDYDEPWTWEDTIAAHSAWARYVEQKRDGNVSKRPVADIIIGAFASRFNGLITRNDKDFRKIFPALKIVVPS